MMNPWALLGAGAAWLVSMAVCGWLMYARGHDDMRNAYTEQQFATAQQTIKDMKTKQAKADQAGEKHDVNNVRVNVDTSAIGRSLQEALAKMPVNSDPYMPVWFVRVFDRSASRDATADPYPGKSDYDASDIRLSQAGALLATNFGKCEANRVQLTDLIAYLKEDRAQLPQKTQSFLDHLNPF